MATTTNYGWTTPDDTALVKDGAAAIRTLGSSVDTTTKNLNPSTTLGDIEYRSSTANTNTRVGIGSSGQALTVVAGVPSWAASATSVLTAKGDVLTATAANVISRLGVGTDGQILKANSGTATGLEWGSVATSGATFISRTTFSAAASVTIDSLFSTTYENYLLCAQINGSSNGITLNAQGRYGATTYTGATYQNLFFGINYNANTLITIRGSGATSWDLGNLATGTGSAFSQQNFIIQRPSASGWLQMTGNITDQNDGDAYTGSANIQSSQAWSGLLFTPSSGTITGQITVYGLAKS